MPGRNLNEDPVEGSRDVIEHELEKQDAGGSLPDRRPPSRGRHGRRSAIRLKPLKEQTIVITGASSGIGLATARKAARAGARVVLASRNGDALAGICREIVRGGGRAEYVRTDVGLEKDVEHLAAIAVERFGGFDTWVNNAGIGLIATADRTGSEQHHKIFETNYFGVVHGSLAALRQFRVQGSPSALINLGSVVSDMPMPYSAAYSASKHAIKGFTDSLRVEVMQEGLPVSVTLIKPSAIDTRFFDHAPSEMGGMGKAPGPHYAPSVVAKAILDAAENPRRQVPVGSTAHLAPFFEQLAPRFVDQRQAGMRHRDLVDTAHQPAGSSITGVPDEGHERSRFGQGRTFSLTTSAKRHRTGLFILSTLATGALLAMASGSRVKPGARTKRIARKERSA